MGKGLIKCPKCGAEFELSQAVSHDIEVEASKKYQEKIKILENEAEKRLEAERKKSKKKEEELSDKMTRFEKQAEKKSKRENRTGE